ncbi:MAG: hypothetical protein FWD56_02620 [Bacteroidales bacterium]|nr:hypothetical protein [Bacteroidales bacterium]
MDNRMTKLDEYKNEKEEFEQWFKKEIELLQSIPPAYHATQNQVVKLYHDLKIFTTTHPGFQMSEQKSKTQIEVEVKNRYGFGCNVCFYLDYVGLISDKLKFVFFGDGIPSIYQHLSLNFSYHLNIVYHYLALLEQISEKFSKLSKLEKEAKTEAENEEIKQDRIKQLQGKSADEWIKSIMNNSVYPYMVEQFSDKCVVHVKVNARFQLSIPIFKKNFQKTVPFILETIRQYEEFKVKGVLVKTISFTHYIPWENDNKPSFITHNSPSCP